MDNNKDRHARRGKVSECVMCSDGYLRYFEQVDTVCKDFGGEYSVIWECEVVED